MILDFRLRGRFPIGGENTRATKQIGVTIPLNVLATANKVIK